MEKKRSIRNLSEDEKRRLAEILARKLREWFRREAERSGANR